jgi:rRNA maturation RNase YbeY
MAAINFFTEDIKFRLKNKAQIRRWIVDTMKNERIKVQQINYIFCSDAYLLGHNIKYLSHDTLTDIITFSYSPVGEKLEGDIFISIERVAENSVLYKESFDGELRRVIIHGVLHLIGYLDKKIKDRKMTRSKEDFYLQRFNNLSAPILV